MTTMLTKPLLILAGSVFLLVNSGFSAEPDWHDYAVLLREHTRQRSIGEINLVTVDYRALKENGAARTVYDQLAAFPVDRLATRQEKLAFYINAYNILALKMVLDHWPLASIKDAGSLFSPVWGKPAGTIGGKPVTLDHIEHEILRSANEPRIHFAIVCASVSCPDLLSRPFEAAQLDTQLEDSARRFLANPGKGLTVTGTTIRVSKIFKWFEEDFQSSGGFAAFIRRYQPNLPPLPIKADIPYDWRLNDAQAQN